jgi:hypothetical protein
LTRDAFRRGAREEPNPALFRAPVDFKVKDLKQTLQELQAKLAERNRSSDLG